MKFLVGKGGQFGRDEAEAFRQQPGMGKANPNFVRRNKSPAEQWASPAHELELDPGIPGEPAKRRPQRAPMPPVARSGTRVPGSKGAFDKLYARSGSASPGSAPPMPPRAGAAPTSIEALMADAGPGPTGDRSELFGNSLNDRLAPGPRDEIDSAMERQALEDRARIRSHLRDEQNAENDRFLAASGVSMALGGLAGGAGLATGPFASAIGGGLGGYGMSGLGGGSETENLAAGAIGAGLGAAGSIVAPKIASAIMPEVGWSNRIGMSPGYFGAGGYGGGLNAADDVGQAAGGALAPRAQTISGRWESSPGQSSPMPPRPLAEPAARLASGRGSTVMDPQVRIPTTVDWEAQLPTTVDRQGAIPRQAMSAASAPLSPPGPEDFPVFGSLSSPPGVPSIPGTVPLQGGTPMPGPAPHPLMRPMSVPDALPAPVARPPIRPGTPPSFGSSPPPGPPTMADGPRALGGPQGVVQPAPFPAPPRAPMPPQAGGGMPPGPGYDPWADPGVRLALAGAGLAGGTAGGVMLVRGEDGQVYEIPNALAAEPPYAVPAPYAVPWAGTSTRSQ